MVDYFTVYLSRRHESHSIPRQLVCDVSPGAIGMDPVQAEKAGSGSANITLRSEEMHRYWDEVFPGVRPARSRAMNLVVILLRHVIPSNSFRPHDTQDGSMQLHAWALRKSARRRPHLPRQQVIAFATSSTRTLPLTPILRPVARPAEMRRGNSPAEYWNTAEAC